MVEKVVSHCSKVFCGQVLYLWPYIYGQLLMAFGQPLLQFYQRPVPVGD